MDFYLENPERLEGQPKRVIANYVESNGILVPRRFDSISSARASGLSILARSEHKQDYDGASGLWDSVSLEKYPSVKSVEELKDVIFNDDSKRGRHTTPCYSWLLGLNPDDVKKEVTYSFWEDLEGFNRTVIADSAIKGRYHITTVSDKWGFVNYNIFENGKVTNAWARNLTPELDSGLSSLIETYEKIRNLGRFEPNHCPLMEFQTVGDKNYFLQYLRTRDFSPATFTLDRKAEEGEQELLFVRGATPPEGITCKAAYNYVFEMDSSWESWRLLKQEDASFDFHMNTTFSELMARRRKIRLNGIRYSLGHKLLKVAVGHDNRSQLFKPEISTVVNLNLFDGEDGRVTDKTIDTYWRELNNAKERGDYAWFVNIYVVSDGKRGFIRNLSK